MRDNIEKVHKRDELGLRTANGNVKLLHDGVALCANVVMDG